jgi:hypothetical protein
VALKRFVIASATSPTRTPVGLAVGCVEGRQHQLLGVADRQSFLRHGALAIKAPRRRPER